MAVNKTIPILLVLAVIAVIGFGAYFALKNQDKINEDAEGVFYGPEEQAVRKQITTLGNHLKNVNLKSPISVARVEIESEYASFLTPELLAQWQEDPSLALGRNAPGLWPKQIKIKSVFKQTETLYVVEGEVQEVTNINDSKEPAAIYPAVFAVEQAGEEWLIVHMEKRPYIREAKIFEVSGTAACLLLENTLKQPDEECLPGVKADRTGIYYALDLNSLSPSPDFIIGSNVAVTGVLEELDVLSNNWKKYFIEGLITATTLR